MNKEILISEEIAAFYAGISKAKKPENDKKHFNDNHTIKFEEVLHNNFSCTTFKDFEALHYEDFLIIYQNLRPMFRHSQRLLKGLKIEQLQLSWMGDIKPLYEIFNCTEIDRNGTGVIEQILLTTSMLEFALGSIFCTKSTLKSPPHLLKDLLRTKELKNCFGVAAIQFLRVLLGTPKSINLRNIVWHGFPKPKTFPKYYISILLLCVHTLGHILQEKKIEIKYRKQINDFSTQLPFICRKLDMPTNFSFDQLKINLHACDLLPLNYKHYWFQIFYYLKNSKFWRFVVLILPQMEFILRLIYAKSNDFDVSAKLDEYYITLDTIFEPIVPNVKSTNDNIRYNNLLKEKSEISQGTLQLMYDLFLAPKGPRLRDKISHGEVAIAAIDNKEICHVLLQLSFNLLTRNELQYPLADYESKFHLNSITKFALNAAIEASLSFTTNFEINFEAIDLKLISNRIHIFRRHKKEGNYMLLICKIAELIIETCKNYQESILFRRSLLMQYELHSKRRRTLESLLKSLPQICSTLNKILSCLQQVFIQLQNVDDNCDIDELLYLQKFLKHSLKIAQSFAKYSHKDSNEWIKAMESCDAFNKLHEQYFLKWKESDF